MAVGCAIADQCLSTLCLQYEVRKFPATICAAFVIWMGPIA